jgi:hypothetical protein
MYNSDFRHQGQRVNSFIAIILKYVYLNKKKPLKIYWLLTCFVLFSGLASGQFRPLRSQPVAIDLPSEKAYFMGNHKSSHFGGWHSDPQFMYKYNNPRQTISPVNSGSYWLGGTTTQSFNNGKFGTIYYYDIMGNMQYARTFIDIAGKNKRGLKILLPTLNQRMFMSR